MYNALPHELETRARQDLDVPERRAGHTSNKGVDDTELAGHHYKSSTISTGISRSGGSHSHDAAMSVFVTVSRSLRVSFACITPDNVSWLMMFNVGQLDNIVYVPRRHDTATNVEFTDSTASERRLENVGWRYRKAL